MYVYLYVYNAIIVKKETLNSKERREYLMWGFGEREGMGKVLYLYYNLKNRKKDKSAEYLVSKLSITFHHSSHIFLQMTSEGFFVVYYLGNNYLTTWLIKICALTVSTSSTSLFQKSEKECTKLLIV